MEQLGGYEIINRYYHDLFQISVRDHQSFYAYWELSDRKKTLLANHFGSTFDALTKVIRVYNVTGIYFRGDNAHRFFDIQLPNPCDNYFFHGLENDATYIADYGVFTFERQFMPIIRSNSLHLPRIGICGDGAALVPVTTEAQSTRVFHRITPQHHENFLPYGLK